MTCRCPPRYVQICHWTQSVTVDNVHCGQVLLYTYLDICKTKLDKELLNASHMHIGSNDYINAWLFACIHAVCNMESVNTLFSNLIMNLIMNYNYST